MSPFERPTSGRGSPESLSDLRDQPARDAESVSQVPDRQLVEIVTAEIKAGRRGLGWSEFLARHNESLVKFCKGWTRKRRISKFQFDEQQAKIYFGAISKIDRYVGLYRGEGTCAAYLQRLVQRVAEDLLRDQLPRDHPIRRERSARSRINIALKKAEAARGRGDEAAIEKAESQVAAARRRLDAAWKARADLEAVDAQPVPPDEVLSDELDLGVSTLPGPERVFEGKQLLEWLLKGLTPDERRLFDLRDVQGLPFGRIGEIIGEQEDTVAQRHSRLHKKLRERAVDAGIQRPRGFRASN